MSIGRDMQAIVDLCEREGWVWSLEIWSEGADIQLQVGTYLGRVAAQISGRSVKDLRRRVEDSHAAALERHEDGVPASAMQPVSLPPKSDIFAGLKGYR